MKRWQILVALGLLTLAGILAWQTPTILRALPSRYVARMPEPIQALGVREHVEILPTAAVSSSLEIADLAPPTAVSTEPVAPTAVPTTASPSVETTTAASPQPSPTPQPPTATPPPTQTPIPFPASARLTNIQHHFQTWNNCGPATLAMALSYFGLYTYQADTAVVLKPNPEDRNVSPHEMAAYVNDLTPHAAINRANGNTNQVRQFVSNNIPVIIETGIDPPGEFSWMDWYGHYLLVVAYDDDLEQVWVYDSWLGTGDVPGEAQFGDDGRIISYADFDRYWRQFNRSYIALYQPEQESLVQEIIGESMNDEIMWEKSLEVALPELEAEEENAFLWFNLGTIYNGLGEYEMAAAAFDKARSLGLPWRMLWYQFGPYEAYYNSGRYQDVIDLADVTLHQRPYFEESFYYRGLAYEALGNEQAARADFISAAEFNPNFTAASSALERLASN